MGPPSSFMVGYAADRHVLMRLLAQSRRGGGRAGPRIRQRQRGRVAKPSAPFPGEFNLTARDTIRTCADWNRVERVVDDVVSRNDPCHWCTAFGSAVSAALRLSTYDRALEIASLGMSRDGLPISESISILGIWQHVSGGSLSPGLRQIVKYSLSSLWRNNRFDDVDTSLATADELGIKVDHSWVLDRLTRLVVQRYGKGEETTIDAGLGAAMLSWIARSAQPDLLNARLVSSIMHLVDPRAGLRQPRNTVVQFWCKSGMLHPAFLEASKSSPAPLFSRTVRALFSLAAHSRRIDLILFAWDMRASDCVFSAMIRALQRSRCASQQFDSMVSWGFCNSQVRRASGHVIARACLMSGNTAAASSVVMCLYSQGILTEGWFARLLLHSIYNDNRKVVAKTAEWTVAKLASDQDSKLHLQKSIELLSISMRAGVSDMITLLDATPTKLLMPTVR
ncbi:unnamed protein product (mitochondrion) [Plasmodiophora brassicae]|uniref:Uncharacterized protein n=1 Tax=Plasmodiophora brassicae TaxID=37360 RepID=A0A3P3YB66_PLABS|nr:unnamed protein product [Plasmodiophora brassicae]